MEIIYVGPLWLGSTCLQRLEAMRTLRPGVTPVDTEPVHIRERKKGLICRIRRKLGRHVDEVGANRQIIRLAEQHDVQILWLDKALAVRPETLRFVRARRPACVIAGYSPDDMTSNRNNQSIYFLRSLPFYDIFFTTKSYGVCELTRLGCQKAVFVGNAYDPAVHRPRARNTADRMRLGGTVGFIGRCEKARALSIRYLAENGIDIRIWGPGWNKRGSCLAHPKIRVEGKPLWADDYASAISNFDINLAFLCKRNRDRQTTRSIEIPACGGFMLAERTDEHLGLFEEGKEAEFFSSDQELLEKVRYYLGHPEERTRIAEQGRERCRLSGYSNYDRVAWMLEAVGSVSGMRV